MTRTPFKTIWVGRIGSKRDQPSVITDALRCRDVGGQGDTKTLLEKFWHFPKFQLKRDQKMLLEQINSNFLQIEAP